MKANERCGRWYTPSSELQESVYFKSTDGHTNQWDLSTRRLNFHIIDLIVKSNGIIIIDSTRKGKSIPDALSKTIPVWCAVLNKALFDEDMVYFPPKVVSENEQNSIRKNLQLFVEKLENSGALKIPDSNGILVKDKLKKPLRPLWVTPNSFSASNSEAIDHIRLQEFYPIVCCTASTNSKDDLSYIQGAADDHETWAHASFNPDMLWNNINTLNDASCSDNELLDIIEKLAIKNNKIVKMTGSASDYYSLIKPSNIAIAKAEEVLSFPLAEFSIIIDLSEQKVDSENHPNSKYLKFPTPPGKKGSNILRRTIPLIVDDLRKTLDGHLKLPKTLVVCDTGTDFCVGVCLCLICLFPPEDQFSKALNKSSIRQRLIWITSQRKVNPSRSTLNSVNSYIMG